MPEISNNFSKGKMNKDFDERIVPSGEYRDAMNIQVSTSENSDVGTVQNILGNSLVPGQDFIGNNATCVGSIADDKSDKLYYFVTNQNLISNGDFSQDLNNNSFADGWSEDGSIPNGWDYDSLNQVMVGVNVPLYNKIRTSIPVGSLALGDAVSITFTVKEYEKGELQVAVYNENGEGVKFNVPKGSGTFSFSGVIGDDTTSTSSFYNRFWIQRVGFNESFTGKIDDVFVTTGNDYIIEYNAKNYGITPVIVDTKKNVLKFRPGNIITGINIIDDILMWTDNINEPRKINITRCKLGLDPSSPNTTHTKLVVNNSVTSTDVEEQHITVIKKRPLKAPKIYVNQPLGSQEFLANCDFSQGSGSVNDDPNDPFDGGGDGQNLITPGGISFLRIEREAGDFSANTQSTMLGNLVDPPAQTVPLANPINLEGGNYLLSTNPFGQNLQGGNTNHNLPIIYRFNYDNGTQDDIYYSETLPQSSDPNNDGTGAIRFDNLDPLNPGPNHDDGAGYLRFHFYNNPSSGPYSYLPLGNNAATASSAEQQFNVGDEIKIYFRWHSVNTDTTTLSVALIDYDGQSADQGFGGNYQVLDTKNFTRDASDVNTPGSLGKAFTHTFTIPASHTGGIIRAVMYNGGTTQISPTGVYGPQNNPDDGDYIDRIAWTITGEFITPEDFYEPTDEITVDSSVNVNSGDLISAPGFGSGLHVLQATTSGNTKTLKLSQSPDPAFYPNILDSNWPTNQWQPTINIANFTSQASYTIGDVLLLSQLNTPGSLPSNHEVRCTILDIFEQIGTPGFVEYKVDVSSIESTVPTTAAAFDTPPNPNVPGINFKTTDGIFMNVVKELEQDRLFEDKFVRFATRWKYEDGEYSAFSPFTDVAFNASSFSFHPTENTYNLGVQNNCESIDLLDIVPAEIPEDVVQVDILFKQENSTTVYSIDSIKPDDPVIGGGTNDWNANTTPSTEIFNSNNIVLGSPTVESIPLQTLYKGKYTVFKENIHAALPENQLLRPWDNVPKKALAQEITGNRIVYGNYTQGYNMIDNNNNNSKPFLTANYKQRSIKETDVIDFTFGQKSLKTFRTYKLGVVYGDEYGRETPIMTSKNSSVKIPWDADSTTIFNGNASRSLQLTASLTGEQPSFASYYKIFVKENSGEYYNLTMDRIYKAENPENLWISFPSSDVNKVQKEDYLILKKQADRELQVPVNNKFKVVDIKNEAPEYIKFIYKEIGNVGTPDTLFVDYLLAENVPQEDTDQIIIFKNLWTDGDGAVLEDIEDKLNFQFSISAGSERIESSRYEILSIELMDENTNDPKYRIKLDKTIIASDGFAVVNGVIDTTLRVSIKQKIAKESDEFDGRFFVKIISDSISNTYLKPLIGQSVDYRLTSLMPLFYFADKQADYGSGDTHADGVGNVTNNYTQNTTTLHTENKSNTEGAWNDLLDFGGNDLKESWFIDRTFMASAQPLDPSDPTGATGSLDADLSGQLWRGGGNDLIIDSLEGIINTDGVVAYQQGFGARAWRNTADPNNQPAYSTFDETYTPSNTSNPTNFFMHLSISPVGNDLHDNNWNAAFGSQGVEWKGVGRGNFGHGANPAIGTPGSVITGGGTQLSIDNFNSQWQIQDPDMQDIANKIYVGSKFRFTGSNEIFTILKFTVKRVYNHTAFLENIKIWDGSNQVNAEDNVPSPSVEYTYNELNSAAGSLSNWTSSSVQAEREAFQQAVVDFGRKTNRRLVYIIELDKDPTDPIYNVDPYTIRDVDTAVNLRFFDETIDDTGSETPQTPAIWETKHKDDVDLDIYYEATGAIPLTLKNKKKSNSELFAPVGSKVFCTKTNSMPQFPSNAAGLSLIVTNWEANNDGWYNIVEIASPGLNVDTSVAFTNDAAGLAAQSAKFTNKFVRFYREDNSFVTAKIYAVKEIIDGYITKLSFDFKVTGSDRAIGLSYYDCFCFGNGVESNRIRDDFNEMTITKGVKASSVLEQQYKEENRKNGLIYSGIYNSVSGVNNLNQFIQAEKITKDLNPTYGSIQKLFQRRVNLVSFCEDRVIKILALKDALFNADGNAQLVATNKVLGEANPFIGDYGISKNPESFAKESYRAYFADKQRGAVLRLSMDGITPISSAGMSDYFKDNLINSESILGSYDNKKRNYNITLSSSGNKLSRGSGSLNQNLLQAVTLSYDEKVKGWTSFKSYIPEFGLSLSNNYYTFNQGELWQHHLEENFIGDVVNRNTFYGQAIEPSTITTVLNPNPKLIKSYNTLNYEGTDGWVGEAIITDQQAGTVNEFIEKEGKYFNYIRGQANTVDLQSFNFQGVGQTIGIEYNI